MQGGKHIVGIRFLIHHVESLHPCRKGGGDLQRHLLPPRGFLGGARFGPRRRHPLTRRHALVRDRLPMNVGMDPDHPQRLPGLVGGQRQGDVPEKSLGPAADRPQPVTIARKAKRRGVMHDAHDRVRAQPLAGFAQVATEHTGQCDLRIGQEPIQRLPVSDRRHLFREAIARLARRQRHDASQALVEPRIAQRVALEFRDDVTDVNVAGLAHAPSDHRRSTHARRCDGS